MQSIERLSLTDRRISSSNAALACRPRYIITQSSRVLCNRFPVRYRWCRAASRSTALRPQGIGDVRRMCHSLVDTNKHFRLVTRSPPASRPCPASRLSHAMPLPATLAAMPRNQPGARRVDDRRVISGILHVLKVGFRWCDCPADDGPSTTVYNRFNRWSHRGFWLKLLDALVGAGAVTRSTAIDSTYVKAQRAAFGARGGARTRRSAARAVVGRPRFTRSPTSSAARMR
jgi:transposase